jgi:hypothetical protein
MGVGDACGIGTYHFVLSVGPAFPVRTSYPYVRGHYIRTSNNTGNNTGCEGGRKRVVVCVCACLSASLESARAQNRPSCLGNVGI